MPLTLRNIARAVLLLIGCAVAALLGLVAVSHGDAAPAWRTPARAVPAGVYRDRLHSESRDETQPLVIVR